MTDDTEKTEPTEQAIVEPEAEPEPEVAPVEAAVKEKKPKAKAKSQAKTKTEAKAKAEAATDDKAPAAAAVAPIASPMAYIQSQYLKSELPDFRPGDTVRVHQKVTEGGRDRTQIFEGVVIKRGGRGVAHTFTVRRIAHAVGVERTFLIHSPRVEKIEVRRRGKVRRARLFYLRQRVGARATRIKEVR